MKLLTKFIDDILFLIGCGCIVYGLSMWNVVVTWIVAGILLIVFSVMVGKAKARHDTE
jgi:cytosine/uracil/thiamine/allantoin permease